MGLLRLIYTVDRAIAVTQRVTSLAQKAKERAEEAEANRAYDAVQRERRMNEAADAAIEEFGVALVKSHDASRRRPSVDLPTGRIDAMAKELGVGTLELMAVMDRRAKIAKHVEKYEETFERESTPPSWERRKGDDGMSTDELIDGF